MKTVSHSAFNSKMPTTVPTNQKGKSHAALNVQNDDSSKSSTSFVSLSQNLAPQLPLNVDLFIPASPPSLSPSVALSIPSKQKGGLLSNTTISKRFNPANPANEGHLEAHFTAPNLIEGGNVMLGAWMTNASIRELPSVYSQWRDEISDERETLSPLKPSSSSVPSTRNYSPSTVHLQGVAEYGESLVAAHAELPLSPNTNLQPHQTNAILWLNLSGGGESGDEKSPENQQKHQSLPPIWLTLKHSRTRGDVSAKWTLNLSQILSWDRTCWNILEDRAPLIRNHVGWVLQIERNGNASNNSNNITSAAQNNVRFGASWQINRNVGLKTIIDNNGSLLKTNVIFKRWKQPRMALSVMHGIDLTSGSGSGASSYQPSISFLGFGLEVETSSGLVEDAFDDSAKSDSPKYQQTTNMDGIKAPPTKIQVNAPPTKSRK